MIRTVTGYVQFGIRSAFRLAGLSSMVLIALGLIPQIAKAGPIPPAPITWHASVGAESPDEGKQALAFLPNEIWIHANDSIRWKFIPEHEVHTVTFLTPTQLVPPPPPPVGPGGCPGVTPDGPPYPTFTGSSCVTSAPSCADVTGDASSCMADEYTVTFPTPGNFKLVCLIHTNMNGTIHVLHADADLPYDQGDYHKQARDEASDLINDSDNPREELKDYARSANEVIMTGEVAATGGGRQSLALVRFFPGTIRIKAGQTVEWTNLDPTTPHTITFGIEPPAPQIRLNVSQEPDGALFGTIPATPNLNSGFLQAAAEDAIGNTESPVFTAAPFPPAGNLGLTRIRVTFTKKGTYSYKCALHDGDGMLGTVIVE